MGYLLRLGIRGTVCLALVASLIACHRLPAQDTPTPQQVQPSKAEMDALWAAEVEGARKLGEIRKNFENSHRYKGVNAQAYVQQLRKEGFICRLQPRERTKFSDGSAERPWGGYTTIEPSISCEREPSRFEECKWFRVGFDLETNPSNAKLPYTELVKQLAAFEINRTVFVCNIEPKSTEYLQFISEGIKKGAVIVIE